MNIEHVDNVTLTVISKIKVNSKEFFKTLSS